MRNLFIVLLLITFSTEFSYSQIAQKKTAIPSKTSKKKTIAIQKKLKIGGQYKGGIIYELYADGSGGKVFFYVSSDNYNSMQNDVENEYRNGLKCYVADDYELQKLFQMDLIGPNAGDGGWTHLWFMGDRRMASYSKP